ncbi:MAG: glycosyltransferase, partial [Candidatus Omnitrophota bacterium]
DIVGFLHADDLFIDNKVIENVVDAFKNNDVDSVYSDLLYVDKQDINKVIRYWKSKPYKKNMFKWGWMPPHPTFFVKREVYEKHGAFNLDLPIAADYENMLRLIHINDVSSFYLPQPLIRMRMGGLSNSSVKNIIQKTSEDIKSWKINGLNLRWYTILLKNLSKIHQFFNKKIQ